MQTLFLDARKKNAKSKRPGGDHSASFRTPWLTNPRFVLVAGTCVSVLPVLLIATLLLTACCRANADLIPPEKTQDIPLHAETLQNKAPEPLERLRDTVSRVDILWPSRPEPPFAEDASNVLSAMALDDAPETRIQGLVGLAKAHSSEAVAALVRALDDPSGEVREVALRELAVLDPDRLVQELVNRLTSSNLHVRESAERALPRLRELVEEPILILLESPDTDTHTQLVLVQALGLMASESAVPALSLLTDQTSNTGLIQAAAHALTEIASPDGLPALERLSRHPNSNVCSEALVGLARIGGPAALAPIEAMAANPREHDIQLRRQAIGYIGLMGGDSSIETLINIMNRYPQARETAAAALVRITGINLGNSPLEWTRWYHEREEARKQSQQQPTGGLLGVISPSDAPSPEAGPNAPSESSEP